MGKSCDGNYSQDVLKSTGLGYFGYKYDPSMPPPPFLDNLLISFYRKQGTPRMEIRVLWTTHYPIYPYMYPYISIYLAFMAIYGYVYGYGITRKIYNY